MVKSSFLCSYAQLTEDKMVAKMAKSNSQFKSSSSSSSDDAFHLESLPGRVKAQRQFEAALQHRNNTASPPAPTARTALFDGESYAPSSISYPFSIPEWSDHEATKDRVSSSAKSQRLVSGQIRSLSPPSNRSSTTSSGDAITYADSSQSGVFRNRDRAHQASTYVCSTKVAPSASPEIPRQVGTLLYRESGVFDSGRQDSRWPVDSDEFRETPSAAMIRAAYLRAVDDRPGNGTPKLKSAAFPATLSGRSSSSAPLSAQTSRYARSGTSNAEAHGDDTKRRRGQKTFPLELTDALMRATEAITSGSVEATELQEEEREKEDDEEECSMM